MAEGKSGISPQGRPERVTPAKETGTTPSPWIEVDDRNLFEQAIGSEGLTEVMMKEADGGLEAAHEAVMQDLRRGYDSKYAALALPELMRPEVPELLAAAATLSQYPDIVVIGIGGSSLGAKAIYHALRPTLSGPNLHFLENVDPGEIEFLLRSLDPDHVAVIAISKSGNTLETAAQLLILRAWLRAGLGAAEAARRQWIVTDAEQGWLRSLAQREQLSSAPVPREVGGRFSVLSAVGLLPLAAAGIPITELLDGAQASASRARSGLRSENKALALASAFVLLDLKRGKRISVMMPYADRLKLFVDWYRQLWAESLGKRRADGHPTGMLPVQASGTVDQHSQLQMYLESRQDKVFSFLEVAAWPKGPTIPRDLAAEETFPYLMDRPLGELLQAEFHATRRTISEAGHPNLTITVPAIDAHCLGQLLDLYERMTVYAGLLYGINPLDQPAVERSKRLAIDRLRSG